MATCDVEIAVHHQMMDCYRLSPLPRKEFWAYFCCAVRDDRVEAQSMRALELCWGRGGSKDEALADLAADIARRGVEACLISPPGRAPLLRVQSAAEEEELEVGGA